MKEINIHKNLEDIFNRNLEILSDLLIETDNLHSIIQKTLIKKDKKEKIESNLKTKIKHFMILENFLNTNTTRLEVVIPEVLKAVIYRGDNPLSSYKTKSRTYQGYKEIYEILKKLDEKLLDNIEKTNFINKKINKMLDIVFKKRRTSKTDQKNEDYSKFFQDKLIDLENILKKYQSELKDFFNSKELISIIDFFAKINKIEVAKKIIKTSSDIASIIKAIKNIENIVKIFYLKTKIVFEDPDTENELYVLDLENMLKNIKTANLIFRNKNNLDDLNDLNDLNNLLKEYRKLLKERIIYIKIFKKKFMQLY